MRRHSHLQGPRHVRPALPADGAWIVQLPGASTRLPSRDFTHEERLRPREDRGEAASGRESAGRTLTSRRAPARARLFSARGVRGTLAGTKGARRGEGLVRAQERRARRNSRLGAGPGAAMLTLAAGGARARAGPWV